MPHPLLAFAVFLSGLLLFAGTVRSEVVLSEREIAWRDNHPIITVATDSGYAPMTFLDDGKPSGIAVDLLRLIEAKTGLQIRWVVGRWSEVLDHAMSHRVDAVLNTDKTPERLRRLLYTRPYYQVPQAIVVRTDAADINSPTALSAQTKVAALVGTSQIDFLRRHHPAVPMVETETTLAQMGLVLTGEADTLIAALPMVHHAMSENLITGLRISGIFQSDELDNLHIAVRNTAPELRAILDKAIADISREQRHEILARWLPNQLLELTHESARPVVVLSEAERRWIGEHPTIRVAADREWAPIEFVGENGAFQGLAMDHVTRIEELVGLRFDFDTESSWPEAVARLENRELDMFTAAVETPERREFARFTTPYLSLPAMIFMRNDETFVNGLTGLAGRRVAVVRNYAVTEFLRNRAENFELVELEDVDDALRSVVRGETDAYVGTLLVTAYHLRQLGISNVMVAGDIPFQINVSMAARSDWPELHAILEKALRAITEQERAAINNRWMGMQISSPLDYTMIWRWSLAGMSILVLFVGWNWYLQRKTATQEAELRCKNRDLQMEVEERRRAEVAAHSASQAKSRLLANMSHELRTPLNAILGFSDMLRQSRTDGFAASRRVEYADHIHSAGRHLLNLVNDTLDLSAVEAGRLTLNEEVFNLDSLLDDIMPMLEGRASKAGVALVRRDVREGVAERTWVVADERRLRQVVINLVDNAIKFTPSGGQVEVAVGAQDDGGLRVAVADNGVGMSADQLKSAFKAFERGSDPFVRASEGVGLGLALSSEIMRAHGGGIDMASHPGKGTAATAWLPAGRLASG